MNRIPNITIENARLCFKNFAGEKQKFTPEGKKTFSVVLDENTAKELEEWGWNIKWFPMRDDQDEPTAHLPVELSWKASPPVIELINGDRMTSLNEDTVDVLDWADITNFDLIVQPYRWEVNGKSGVKAYLKEMYATQAFTPFTEKYKDLRR